MSWQTKMGRDTIISTEIEGFLLKKGFERDVFKPTFTHEGEVLNAHTLDEHCLTLSYTNPSKETLTIYITNSEAYLEVKELVKTSVNVVARPRFLRSNLVEIPQYIIQVDEIEEILNRLTA